MADPERLGEPWREWIAENLARGAARDDILQRLRDEGVPGQEARQRVSEIESSPILGALRRALHRASQLEDGVRLLAEVRGTTTVERAPYPGAALFFQRYWETSTPVVFEDFTQEWPALERWTPEYFAEVLGDTTIEAIDGRDADPDYDINFRAHSVKTTMRAFVERVRAAGLTNDFYLIANTRNLERAALSVLFEDLRMPGDLLQPATVAGSSALWFGPAGTVTPLHHDTSNILLCQFMGRKRVRLLPPWAHGLWPHARGVYSRLDAESEHPALAGTRVVELAPGETLFVPVGWWHHVRALDVSITLALNNFARPNIFEWYKPGRE